MRLAANRLSGIPSALALLFLNLALLFLSGSFIVNGYEVVTLARRRGFYVLPHPWFGFWQPATRHRTLDEAHERARRLARSLYIRYVHLGVYEKRRRISTPVFRVLRTYSASSPDGVDVRFLFLRRIHDCEEILPDWWCAGEFDPLGD